MAPLRVSFPLENRIIDTPVVLNESTLLTLSLTARAYAKQGRNLLISWAAIFGIKMTKVHDRQMLMITRE